MPTFLRQRRLSIRYPFCNIASFLDSQYLLVPPAFLSYHSLPESHPLASHASMVGQKSYKVFVPSASLTPKGQWAIGLGNMGIAVEGGRSAWGLWHVLV